MQGKNFRRRSQTVSLIVVSFLLLFSASTRVLSQEKSKPVSPTAAESRTDGKSHDRNLSTKNGRLTVTVGQQPGTQMGAKPAQTKVSTGESNSTPQEGLPFRVELGEGISHPEAEVILAVRAVTVFHCPEPPMQVLIGDTTGLGLVESIEGHDRADFYLRPTMAGIRTNMWIEMPSATVHVLIRTVAVKEGAGARGYNGEVFVRLPGFRERAESVRARVAAIEKELGECAAHREELKRQIEEEKRRVAAETATLMADDTLALLAAASFTSQLNSKAVRAGSAWVKQIGSTLRLGTRRLWAVLEIENRDKSRTLWIQELSASKGYKARTREGRLPPIGPGKRVRVAVMIERAGEARPDYEFTLPRLSLTVEGNSGFVELRP